MTAPRTILMAAVEKAHAAAHAATIAASYHGINKARSAEFRKHAEDAAYACIDLLFQADLASPSDFSATAREVVGSYQPETEAA